MTIAQCAALVERADPERFMAAMAAPLAARERLLVLYAFNLEVAKAPWVTKEAMIAEMRLQWWRDICEAAVAGAEPRGHEVAGPLNALIKEANLPPVAMDRMIEARRHDAWGEGFAGLEGFSAYLEDTAGGLMWLSAKALGASDQAETPVRAYGWASGLANYLRAVPELIERGRHALVDPSDEGVKALAELGLSKLKEARAGRGLVARAARPALLAGWQAEGILRQAAQDPRLVFEGGLGPSEFAKRGRLLWQVVSGRY